MYTKDVNERSPLRILERSIHGGLGKGNLGVVMAQAGVGKTACMVQIALDDLMRGRAVLHIALGQTAAHVKAWYDALYDELARSVALEDRDAVALGITRNRVIFAYADPTFSPMRIRQLVDSLALQFRAEALILDGFDWSHRDTRAHLEVLKALAKQLDAELWMSAQLERGEKTAPRLALAAPCDAVQDLIDVALYLEPSGAHVRLRLLKDHDVEDPSDTHLLLECDTLKLVADEQENTNVRFPAGAYTLLSGAAQGSEAEFGACAERFGLQEVNFTFEGHPVARSRGLVELTETELKEGDVSSSYLVAHMHRTYPGTPIFKKVLQSIWHQVNTAGEVFVVGSILPDNTVKGGTGWAAELGRHEKKPVFVFDQEKRGWFAWRERAWVADPAPVITKTRFTGTGTRFLHDEGRAAIRALFERSFGGASE